MPAWEEVRAHLRSRYQLVVDDAEWVGMVWAFTYRDLTIEQRLKVERVATEAGDWLVVRAAVCPANKIDPLDALRFSARLAIGGLIVAGEMCYLRTTFPMKTVTYEDLDRAIEYIARETARLSDPRINSSDKSSVPFTLYDD